MQRALAYPAVAAELERWRLRPWHDLVKCIDRPPASTTILLHGEELLIEVRVAWADHRQRAVRIGATAMGPGTQALERFDESIVVTLPTEKNAAFDIRPCTDTDLPAAWRLLADNGWAHRIADMQALSRLVAASQRTVVAIAGDELAGFARAVTDGLSNGYLSMVVVAPAFRRRGIGHALVERIVGDDDGITWVLRAGRNGARDFFARQGFVDSQIAMERTRGHRPA